MSLGVRYKDPEETRLFTFDWSRHLVDDVIDTFLVEADTGLTVGSSAKVSGDQGVSVLLSGGVAGQIYTVTNTITIAATGETLQRSGEIAVRER